jgi:hypothetical protein
MEEFVVFAPVRLVGMIDEIARRFLGLVVPSQQGFLC